MRVGGPTFSPFYTLGEKYGKHRICLYCVDGFACFKYTNGPHSDRIRKES